MQCRVRCGRQVYYVAKQCSSRCSPEEYAIALAKHFVDTYPKVRAPPPLPPLRAPPLYQEARSTRTSHRQASLCAATANAQVSKAKVKVEAKPWQRITTATGEPHDHGVQLIRVVGLRLICVLRQRMLPDRAKAVRRFHDDRHGAPNDVCHPQ